MISHNLKVKIWKILNLITVKFKKFYISLITFQSQRLPLFKKKNENPI